MRKHLFVTLLLACGMPLTGNFAAYAAPEPLQQSQSVVTIKGIVLDENNEPVIGASVVQKGVSTNATATDASGNFALRVKPGTMLRISYVGYKTVEVKAVDGMNVTIQPSSEMLNELVAVGYGSQKRANLTGAVATVDVAKTMDSRPVEDVTRALQGAVPGLTITTSNGDFSSTPTIKIRGVGTLTNGQNSAPLIVVDGVPVEDLSYINPDDVADISVLKDASSSAVYGTRAAFGVILITTKGGSTKDRVSLKYSNNFAWNQATDLPTFNNTVDDLETALQAYARTKGSYEIFGMNYWDVLPYAKAWQQQHGGKRYEGIVGLHPYVDANNVGDYRVLDDGTWLRYADWNTGKTLMGTAPAQKHNVSLEGTSGKTTYRLSFGYDSKEGLMRFNPEKLRRYVANANISTEIFPWLKAGTRINFSQREFTEPNLQRNSYQYMWRWPSFFETYGTIDDEEGNPMMFRNEASIRQLTSNEETVRTQTRLQAWMQANLFDGLTLNADFTYQLTNMNYNSAYTPYTTWNNWTLNSFRTWSNTTQSGTTATQENDRTTLWTMNVYGAYAKTIADDHNFKIMAGATAEEEEYRYFSARRTGLMDYNLPNLALTNGTTYTTSAAHTHRATAGFFGRINYDYKGIYLLEANGRYDGSSRFPEADQWAFFPSFSAGYRFSEEAYFAPLKQWISNGKLRASYGHIGNEGVGSNRFLSTIATVGAANVHWLQDGQKITELAMPTLVSSSLTWERIVTTDVGLDLGLLNNSINLGFDWFQRDTKDMLAPGIELPSVLGTGAPYVNAGSLRSRGWELSIGWNHNFGEVGFYANFNISDARTKITKWDNPNGTIYTYIPGSGDYTPGQYFGDIWGFETDRFFEESDFNGKNADGTWNYKPGVADQSGMENISGLHFGPGDVKYKDLNGDGVINNGNPDMKDEKGNPIPVGTLRNHGDLKVIGNSLPRYEYSLRLGANWKGFDLDLFFQGVGKRSMWATGSMITPMAQANLGTFEHQQDYNHYILDVDEATHTYNITGYEVNQDNFYPNMVEGIGGATGNFGNIGRGTFNFYPQSKYLINMAYLRLKNVTLGYTLPRALTQKALIQKARVYVSGENLFFLYNGARKFHLDPEISQGYSSAANDGIGGYGRTVPMMRSFSFGLQVTF